MDGSAPFAFSLVSGSSPGGGVGSSIPRIGCQPDQSCVPGLESRLSREKLLISLYNEAYIVGATLSIDNHPELERTCPARIALRLLPSHSLLPAYCKASRQPSPSAQSSSQIDRALFDWYAQGAMPSSIHCLNSPICSPGHASSQGMLPSAKRA